MPTTLAALGAVPYDPADFTDCPRGLPLFGRNGSYIRAWVLVDAADYYVLSNDRWFLHAARSNHPYAARRENGKILLMHRLILGLTDPALHGDHINRNTLDNRRANLRIVTPAENMQNRGSWGRLGYRGVTETPFGRFVARGGVGGKVYIGTFATPEEAAAAAQAWREAHMSFATD